MNPPDRGSSAMSANTPRASLSPLANLSLQLAGAYPDTTEKKRKKERRKHADEGSSKKRKRDVIHVGGDKDQDGDERGEDEAKAKKARKAKKAARKAAKAEKRARKEKKREEMEARLEVAGKEDEEVDGPAEKKKDKEEKKEKKDKKKKSKHTSDSAEHETDKDKDGGEEIDEGAVDDFPESALGLTSTPKPKHTYKSKRKLQLAQAEESSSDEASPASPTRQNTTANAPALPREPPPQTFNLSRMLADSDKSDSDSSDGEPAPKAKPAMRGSSPVEVDFSSILRGRSRSSAASAKNTEEKEVAKTRGRPRKAKDAEVTTAKPSGNATPAKGAANGTISEAAAAAAYATAVKTRGPYKKKDEDESTRAATDDKLRKELADESVMNEFLASKWIEIKELQRLEAAGVLRYKRGRFSEQERAAIRDFVDTFRKSHRLTQDQVEDIIMAKGRSTDRSAYPKFFSELAECVPGRPVRYVKEAVKRMYDPRARKGAWTKEQDEDLKRAYELHPNEWTKIGAIVDRSDFDCRDRWRGELKYMDTRNSGHWTEEETQALIKAVTEANTKLGHDVTAPDVPWTHVVELMGGTRSTTQCRKKWTDSILPSLQSDSTLSTMTPRDLVNRLRELKLKHEGDMSWSSIAKGWDTNPASVRSIWHRLKHAVDGWENMSFPKLLSEMERNLDA